MEEKGFTTLGNDLLTGNIANSIHIEDLIAAPNNDKNMIQPFNTPDMAQVMAIGDVHAGKIKVLAVPSDRTGVGKYRTIDPHRMLHKLYKDEFYVEINPEPNYNNLEYFKKFDIIHFNKTPTQDINVGLPILKQLKALGCKIVVDTDDYWRIESFNPHFQSMHKYKTDVKLLDMLKEADYVTTTTPIFAAEIKKFCKNVIVLPNAIDPDEPQFIPQPVESEKVRIGFLGGSSHLDDIGLLPGLCNRLIPYSDKAQLVLIGFDTRGSMIEAVENGRIVRRPMKPTETVWYEYEKIFTSNMSLLKDYPKYIEYLEKYTQEPYLPETPEVERNMPYRRLWTRDIHSYAKNYNNLDISLAPLVETKFNMMKSQLKVVEAGFYKKALVAQNFGPYTLDLIHIIDHGKVNPKGNAYLVDSRQNHKDWYKGVKYLIDNPEVRKMMAENLYETVKMRYDLKTVTAQRAEFYRSIV